MTTVAGGADEAPTGGATSGGAPAEEEGGGVGGTMPSGAAAASEGRRAAALGAGETDPPLPEAPAAADGSIINAMTRAVASATAAQLAPRSSRPRLAPFSPLGVSMRTRKPPPRSAEGLTVAETRTGFDIAPFPPLRILRTSALTLSPSGHPAGARHWSSIGSSWAVAMPSAAEKKAAAIAAAAIPPLFPMPRDGCPPLARLPRCRPGVHSTPAGTLARRGHPPN
jgi:hypothetical protein